MASNNDTELEGFLDMVAPGEQRETLKQALLSWKQRAVDEVEKAYGGCHKCYGKGYASYKTQHTGYGTDGDIGGFEGHYKRDIPIEMKFCSCDRGKQLSELQSGENNE